MGKRPDLPSGGFHLPLTADGVYRFEPPVTFSARDAFSFGDVRVQCLADPGGIIVTFHVNWDICRRHSAKRVSVDQGEGNMHLVDYVDGALEHREVCRAVDTAPHVLFVGTSTASMFNEELQANAPFLEDIMALHATDVFSKCSS